LAKLFKEVMANESGAEVMTDMTGEFNKVIMVSRHENLSAYEKNFEKHMNPDEETKKSMAKMEGYQDMYITGRREIYRVW
jgi:hypothetical protein